MNFPLFSTLLLCLLSVVPTTKSQSLLLNYFKSQCQPNCADSHDIICKMSKCGSMVTRYLCPRTCGICKPCNPITSRALVPSEKITECEMGTCVDVWKPSICFLYVTRKLCFLSGSNCRNTCKKCKACELPPTKSPCVPAPECQDVSTACKEWNNEGYCKVKDNKFPQVRTVCQKTCKVCTVCPEPNTALPPIPK